MAVKFHKWTCSQLQTRESVATRKEISHDRYSEFSCPYPELVVMGKVDPGLGNPP